MKASLAVRTSGILVTFQRVSEVGPLGEVDAAKRTTIVALLVSQRTGITRASKGSVGSVRASRRWLSRAASLLGMFGNDVSDKLVFIDQV